MVGHYFHPLDMIISGFIPNIFGAYLLGKKLHLFSYLLFLVFRIS